MAGKSIAPTRNIIGLDFTPYDVEEAIRYLKRAFDSGDLHGLIFAAKMKSRGSKLLYGTAGSLDEPIQAVGAAAMLLSNVTDAVREN